MGMAAESVHVDPYKVSSSRVRHYIRRGLQMCKIGPEHIRSHHMTRKCHAGVLLAGERLLKYVAKIQSPFLKKRVSSNHMEHRSL